MTGRCDIGARDASRRRAGPGPSLSEEDPENASSGLSPGREFWRRQMISSIPAPWSIRSCFDATCDLRGSAMGQIHCTDPPRPSEYKCRACHPCTGRPPRCCSRHKLSTSPSFRRHEGSSMRKGSCSTLPAGFPEHRAPSPGMPYRQGRFEESSERRGRPSSPYTTRYRLSWRRRNLNTYRRRLLRHGHKSWEARLRRSFLATVDRSRDSPSSRQKCQPKGD